LTPTERSSGGVFREDRRRAGRCHEDRGTWYAADETEIGRDIWGEFAIIQEVSNDTGTGDHGVLYVSFYFAGFGRFSLEH
jgi:hypothetical protein